jgi:hypothetical protein
MGMNTMNLVTTASTAIPQPSRATDLTTLDSHELEAWFAEAGLVVTDVAHCTSASCPVCFGHDISEAARAA